MKFTHVALILDKSSSMGAAWDEAISGFNEQLLVLKNQANPEHKILATLIQFNGSVEVTYTESNIYDVAPLTKQTYIPDGTTAMYDAVGQGINILSSIELGTEDAILVVVVTDGAENSSRTFNQEQIASLIKEKEATERWTFVYLVANQDEVLLQKRLNLSAGNVMRYTSDAAGTTMGLNATNASTSAYFNARNAGKTQVANFYDNSNLVAQDDD